MGKGRQGRSVSLSADGNTAIVGGNTDNSSAGAIWVWTRSGGVWTQQGTKLVGSGAEGTAAQGYSVSLSADGNTAIVGGFTDSSYTGAMWVWTRSGGVWTQQGTKLVGSGAVGANVRQGQSVSLSADGNTAIVGGRGDNSNAGAAWVFTTVVAAPAVTLISPGYSSSPGYTISTLSPSFFWNRVASATVYGLQLYKKNNSIYELVYNNDNITNTSIALPAGTISDASQYYWQVRAKVDNNWGSYSSPYYFHVSVSSLTPTIFLSSSVIQTGEVLAFSGINFSVNNQAKAIITSNNGYDTVITINTNNIGYLIHSLSLTAPGNYTIYCKDINTGNLSSQKSFEVKGATISYFSIINPYAGYKANVGETIFVKWNDNLTRANSYPIVGSQRKYNYYIEKSSNNGSSWEPLETVNGLHDIDQLKTFSTVITIADANSNYLIRVRDGYVVNRTTESVPIQILSSVVSNLSAEFIWDNSYTDNVGQPIGVVTDATSRFYIKVWDSQNNTINKVTFTLFDDDNNTETRILGKLMEANNIKTYSDEANNANQVSIPVDNPQQNNEFWCWYVAPDDYIGINTPSGSTSREVKVRITAQYSGGTIKEIIKKITVERPPVVLVHGLNSDISLWNDYMNVTVSSFFKFNKYRLTIGGQESFNNNASSIISQTGSPAFSIPGVVRTFRDALIACNQVYYVGHSMGGNVLRYAETNFHNRFFNQKNYNKGYINKFITLDTPHKGSPFANILKYKFPLVKTLANISSLGLSFSYLSPMVDQFFDQYYQRDLSGFYNDITPALKDLIMNTQDMNPTTYKSHVFIGDIIKGSENLETIPDNIALNLNIDFVLSTVINLLYFNQIRGLDEDFIKFSGVSISNSDLIVPLNSQLSDLLQSSSLATYTVNFHSAKTGSPSIEINSSGQVAELLDKPISDPSWGYLPVLQKSSSYSLAKLEGQNFVMDSSFISILSPHNLDSLYVDSLFNLTFSLSDTLNLKKISVFYQDKFIEDTSKQTNYNYSLTVSNNFIDTQKVAVLAFYSFSDSAIISGKSVNIIIKPNSSPNAIKASDNFVYLLPDENYYPDVNIYFEKYIGKIGNSGTALDIKVENPEILSCNSVTKKITAIKGGETSAIIEYGGLKDTIYFKINGDNITGIDEDENNAANSSMPNKFELFQNYPNPFNPTTTIKYSIPQTSFVKIQIYDMLGRAVKTLVNEEKQAGNYEVEFNGSKLSSGVYFYSITANNFHKTNKMILAK